MKNSTITMHIQRKLSLLSETSHGIKRFGVVHSYLDGAAEIAQSSEFLVDCGLARSEAALIRSNQCFDAWLQSLTQYAREKGYSPIVSTYRRVFLFHR